MADLNPNRHDIDATAVSSGTGATSHFGSGAARQPSAHFFQPGTTVGNRYEIIALMGEGGMGAVYKAQDRELDRAVALKTVRADLASHPDMVRRFRQELILARQVTHRNVVRIFDIGEAEGIKFISMEFVEGEDLRSLLQEKGKFSPDEAVALVEQVCHALEAAHAEGVIHRDLKPANIMRDHHGRIVVMDFGLARTLESGLTETGGMVGTIEYMSPEQALGQEVDTRSDIFAIGLIFYELLTGKTPYKAESAIASLLRRAQERAIPVCEIEAGVPQILSDIVARCLERDRNQRYQSATEIIADLQAYRGGGAIRASTVPVLEVPPRPKSRRWHYVIAAVLLVALLGGGLALRHAAFRPATAGLPAKPELSLAVVPFRNASGDAKLDWLSRSLGEMLRTDIGQSAQLKTVSSNDVNQMLQDLRLGPQDSLDSATIKHLADFTGAEVLISGQYTKFNEQIRLDVWLQDLKHNRTAPVKAEASNESALPAAIDQLAQSIRDQLALPKDTVAQMQASAFKPSTSSMAALKAYSDGMLRLSHGKDLEAQKAFQTATESDPQFALAFAALGQTYANLGYGDKAEEAAHKAADLAQKLPQQERDRILAIEAQVSSDNNKAIEYYTNLAKASPNDADIQLTLAQLYRNIGNYDNARDHLGRLLTQEPKNARALVALADVEAERHNPRDALDYINRALTIAVQMDDDELRGRVVYETGYIYKLLNRPDDALRNYQESLAIRRRLGEKAGTAQALAEIADVENSQGKPDLAIATYKQAIQLQREIGDKTYLSHTLMNLGGVYTTRGQYDEGLKNFKESLQLQRELHNEDYEASCLSNIGSIYFFTGRYDDALIYYQQALGLMQKLKNQGQMAAVLYNVGDTDARLGQYEDAINNYLRGLQLARESHDKEMAAFGAYGLAKMFTSQGRYGAALSSGEEAVKYYRELKDRTPSMVQALGAHGQVLALLGRSSGAEKVLKEQLKLAQDIKSDMHIAQALELEGERLFYDGNVNKARSTLQQALLTAARSKDPETTLMVKAMLAEVTVASGASRGAVPELRKLAQEADARGLKNVSSQCSLSLVQALINARDYRNAAEEADRVRRMSDKMGFKLVGAKTRYLQGAILRATGKPSEAAEQEKQAREILHDLSEELHADSLLKRADLRPIVSQAQ